MSILNQKELTEKLRNLASRMDSTLEHNHLQLTIYDVQFLKDLANEIESL